MKLTVHTRGVNNVEFFFKLLSPFLQSNSISFSSKVLKFDRRNKISMSTVEKYRSIILTIKGGDFTILAIRYEQSEISQMF